MGTTVQVDDRCRRDADLRRDLVAGMVIRRNLSMFEQRNVPEFRSCVRIECVYAGVLRGYVKYIAQSLARDFSPCGIKGLSIYFPVDMNDEQLPKCPGIYVLQSEDFLLKILSGPCIVVVPRQNVLRMQGRA
jgi:hypothetical protein